MAGEEVLIPDKLRILGSGFSVLGVEKSICGRYKDNLNTPLAVVAPSQRPA
jgi:hypothetical protein